MQVVSHCKGLPLAIEVVGRSLSNRPYELWQKMVKELSQGHSILDSNTKILDVLKDNSILKECFMDLALFPEDQRIPLAAIVDIWVELYGLDNNGIEVMVIVNKLDSMNLANVSNKVQSMTTYISPKLFHPNVLYTPNNSIAC